MRIRFDDFRLDSDTRQLTEGDEPVPISPKAFQLLAYLVEKRPKALSMRELYRHLWPDTHVEKANLRNLIAEIRAATRDEPKSPRLVRTVFGFGYAFIGECTGEQDRRGASPYHLVNGASDFPLYEGENVVGRERGSAVTIDAPGISRRHALLFLAGNRLHVEDLGSKNGTFVDGERVRERTAVSDGSEVRFGHVKFWIRSRTAAESTLTEA
jgi:DNA-binding winged helix-turn-helix (wHTH) protein